MEGGRGGGGVAHRDSIGTHAVGLLLQNDVVDIDTIAPRRADAGTEGHIVHIRVDVGEAEFHFSPRSIPGAVAGGDGEQGDEGGGICRVGHGAHLQGGLVGHQPREAEHQTVQVVDSRHGGIDGHIGMAGIEIETFMASVGGDGGVAGIAAIEAELVPAGDKAVAAGLEAVEILAVRNVGRSEEDTLGASLGQDNGRVVAGATHSAEGEDIGGVGGQVGDLGGDAVEGD